MVALKVVKKQGFPKYMGKYMAHVKTKQLLYRVLNYSFTTTCPTTFGDFSDFYAIPFRLVVVRFRIHYLFSPIKVPNTNFKTYKSSRNRLFARVLTSFTPFLVNRKSQLISNTRESQYMWFFTVSPEQTISGPTVMDFFFFF